MFNENVGLDYESAVDATPRNYAVSFGNGNDGVSHAWPNYTVRTCDPYRLAAAAVIDSFKPAYQAWAAKSMMIDGEPDCTISATIFDPPDDETEHEFECPECGHEWRHGARESDCPECDETDIKCSDPESCWSQFNGAWLICEIFLADDQSPDAADHTSLAAAFSDVMTLARVV